VLTRANHRGARADLLGDERNAARLIDCQPSTYLI